MSFRALDYPSKVFCNFRKHATLYGNIIVPVRVALPLSVVLQTYQNENLRDSTQSSGLDASSRGSGFLLNQQKGVGIIGGVSVDSTLSFVRKLVKLSSDDEESGIPFVLCSDPMLNKELLHHERSSFSRTEHLKLDHMPIVENLRRKRDLLESSGACCIAIPCHITHFWHDEVSKGCSVPVLHIGECVARELKEANLKPLEAGSPLRIGVLSTSAGIYQDKLHNEGFDVVLPDKATMEHTIDPAIEALTKKDVEGAQTLLRIALQVLLVRGVNTVILATDELRELLPQDDPLLKKCIDPMDALARSTIKYAQADEIRA
ncbi:putative Racemase and epimerase [Heracleum sosnowskyi]|uniref:Racemase and epimerase n=1 Tax=Heracleum sosnowskyi TaxID=360622 RepID=A0AAD8HDF8_9APIA|nr:putative Racemase and epimerase [Heracleum sosnowskyi]